MPTAIGASASASQKLPVSRAVEYPMKAPSM